MPHFEAKIRIVVVETWRVEARTENEARKKFIARADGVEPDAFGEVMNWEVHSLGKYAP